MQRRGRGSRRSDGERGIIHGGARPERKETGRLLEPSRLAWLHLEVLRGTALPKLVSERRGEAPVDGGDESRRRLGFRRGRKQRGREGSWGGSEGGETRWRRLLELILARVKHRATARRGNHPASPPLPGGRRFCRKPLQDSGNVTTKSFPKEN